MSDPRLSSPSSIRLVAATAAAVASLGVVALGVQLGTSGLVGGGPGRNPGSTTATPASASVQLPRSRPGAILEQQLIALVPGVGASSFGSSSAPAGPLTSGPSTVTAPPAAPAAPTDGGGAPAPAPAPGPAPLAPPIPTPTAPLPAPAPTVPAPAPTVPPALDPVVDPVVEPVGDAVDGLGLPIGQQSEAATPAPAPTLDGLIRLLLGP